MSDGRQIISSARLIALCTLASRVTGMARDMVLMQVFGASKVNDAFQFAFQIPNLFRRLFAEGAMSAVFVPAFSATLEAQGRDAAWRLLARTLALLATTLIAVILLLEALVLALWIFLPEPVMTAVADGAAAAGAAATAGHAAAGQPAARHLLLSLTALMLPFMLTICVLALLSSILNCVGSFVPAALAPLVLNLGMLLGVWLLGPALSRSDPAVQIYGVAGSVLVAGVAQLLILWPALRRHGVTLGWRFDPRDLQVRRMLTLMGPVALGQGVLLIGVFLDTQICWFLTRVGGEAQSGALLGWTFRYPLAEGAVSILSVAQRLYQFPLGVLAIPLAIAAFPALSRLAARGDWPGWTAQMQSSLRLSLFAGLIAGALMCIVADPIVKLLFEYRRFTAADTLRAGRVLACYGVGLWAFCAQHIVLRGYYSISDVRTPLKISAVLVPLNLLLSLVLVWFEPLREAAFGVSTSVTASLNVAAGLWLLQRRTGALLLDRATLSACGRMIVATAAGVAAVCLLRPLLLAPDATGMLIGQALRALPIAVSARVVEVAQRGIDVAGSLALGLGVYMLVAGGLRLPEPWLVLARLRKVRAGHCGGCGYDLSGKVSGRCPQCGQAFEARGAVS